MTKPQEIEHWRSCIGWPEYSISSYGNVHGIKSILKQHKKRYAYVYFSKKGVQEQQAIHRLVAKAFIPNPKDYLEVNHLDGNGFNNCVDNLEWCTRKQNVRHAVENGLHPKGETCGRFLLTENDVIFIRATDILGDIEWAYLFNADPNTIRFARIGRSWAYLNKIHPPRVKYTRAALAREKEGE